MTEAIIKYEARDGSDIQMTFETIRKYLVHGRQEYVTQQELMFFGGICKARGLNPFAKDCYLIKYSQNDPAAIITSIDYFRARAKVQPDCQGWKAGIIVLREGQPVRTNGLMMEGDKLIGGWFTAQPKGWAEPFELEVNLKSYQKKKQDGSITKFWQEDSAPTQIRKVAESQGLREVWPSEFSKLYVEEEVNAGAAMDAAFSVTTTARTLTPEGESNPDPYAVKDPEPPGNPPPSPPQEWKCQTCGISCVSERGLKKHQTQAHTKPEPVDIPTGPAIPPPPEEPPHPADGPGPVTETETDEGKDFFEEAKNYEEALSQSGDWAKLMTAFAVHSVGEIKLNRRAYFLDQCEKRLNKLIGG